MSLQYFQVCASRDWKKLEVPPAGFSRPVIEEYGTFDELLRAFLAKKQRLELLSGNNDWKVFVREKFLVEFSGWIEVEAHDSIIGVMESFSATCIRFLLSPLSLPPSNDNAFAVLMRFAQAAAGPVYPAVDDGNTMEAALFNDLRSLCLKHNTVFPSTTAAKELLVSLRNLLWVLEPSISNITATTGRSFPVLFLSEALRDWSGFDAECHESSGKHWPHVYNQYLRKKQAKPRISRTDLLKKCNAVSSFLVQPWVFSPSLSWLFPSVEQLVDLAHAYVNHLEKTNNNMQLVSVLNLSRCLFVIH